jgi:hypothetical protein
VIDGTTYSLVECNIKDNTTGTMNFVFGPANIKVLYSEMLIPQPMNHDMFIEQWQFSLSIWSHASRG